MFCQIPRYARVWQARLSAIAKGKPVERQGRKTTGLRTNCLGQRSRQVKLADTGLRKQPFRTHGKPIVLVPYASQKNALQFLNETRVNQRGLGLFHGPSLSGKTTTIRQFATTLPGDYLVAVVDGAQVDSATLLKNVLSQYGYDHGFDTATDRFNMIRVVALQQAASGQAPLLVIENIHKINPVVLELLTEMADMEVDGNSALRIVLSSNKQRLPVFDAP